MMLNAKRKKHQSRSRRGESKYGKAVVIGGSITGLTSARVLKDYFGQVTIVERDQLGTAPEFRPGLPQSHHAHTIQPRGQAILEDLFPGLVNEVLARGAVAIDNGNDVAFYQDGKWHKPKSGDGKITVAASRMLLEAVLYARVRKQVGIDFIMEHEVVSLAVDESGEKVIGVNLRNRNAPHLEVTKLEADLVVDASGRSSRAYAWLSELGYPAPGETCINAHTGYASRIYHRPDRHPGNWKTLYVRPLPEYSSRGGIIVPLENNRWHVTLVGMGGDYPATNEMGFMEFARSLPVPEFYATIQKAEALTRIYGYRNTENRMHHYENQPAYLEGFLVSGDAALTLNPVYALGMTSAILGSQALERSLREQNDGDLKGLAQVFQKQLARSTSRLWQLSISEDLKWSETEIVETPPQAQGRRPTYGLSQTVAVAA